MRKLILERTKEIEVAEEKFDLFLQEKYLNNSTHILSVINQITLKQLRLVPGLQGDAISAYSILWFM